MIAALAARMLVMSAEVTLVACATRSPSVREISVTLRSTGDSLRNLDAAQIERHHQRQQHRELDRRDAALVAREPPHRSGACAQEGSSRSAWQPPFR